MNRDMFHVLYHENELIVCKNMASSDASVSTFVAQVNGGLVLTDGIM